MSTRLRHVTLAACAVLAGCTEATRPERPVMIRAPVAPARLVADPPEPGPEFWERELAWARSRFPVLRDFTLDVDFRPLLAWIPVGNTVTLYLRAEYRDSRHEHVHQCVAAHATRSHEDDGIGLFIPGPERIEQGRTVRDYTLVGVHDWGVTVGGAGGKQGKRANGTWEELDGYGSGYHQLGAFVGPVEGDTAYFRNVQVEIRTSCGPLAEVPCDDGERRGHNMCNRCDTVTVELESPRVPRGTPPPPSRQCDVPCPVIENPELERIHRLEEHFPVGYAVSPSYFSVALYRTRLACEGDTAWSAGRR